MEHQVDPRNAERCAIEAARAAGALLRRSFRSLKIINSSTQHDIKLELDIRSQKLIGKILRAAFPGISILGEEGVVGDLTAEHRWVVDPIDGTVNFAYGIPHCCVSIALQRRALRDRASRDTQHETVVGVVYDPFCDELWTARKNGRARLNGKPIAVSGRKRLSEAIVSIGFAKHKSTLNEMIPVVMRLAHRVRKIRVMGSAALAMTYVASGRMDAYVEAGIRLWDIAAGGLILECAGGDHWHEPLPGQFKYRVLANNGPLRGPLRRLLAKGLADPPR